MTSTRTMPARASGSTTGARALPIRSSAVASAGTTRTGRAPWSASTCSSRLRTARSTLFDRPPRPLPSLPRRASILRWIESEYLVISADRSTTWRSRR